MISLSIVDNLEIKSVKFVANISCRTDELPEFLALKILSASSYGAEKDIFERQILKHLKEGDPDESEYDHICHLLDDFEHKGPNRRYICLVFELMGETLQSFGTCFSDYRIPEHVMRRFAIQLIIALDYAHDHNVIHTGASIVVKFYFLSSHYSMKLSPIYPAI